MNFSNYRNRVGRFILFSNIILFILIIILYGLKGFTDEELTELLKYLIPIKSIYLTAVVKFVIEKQKWNDKVEYKNLPLHPLFKTVAKGLIYSHISILYCLILFTAFNVISFIFLINTLVVVESLFGIYIGLIVAEMFKSVDMQIK